MRKPYLLLPGLHPTPSTTLPQLEGSHQLSGTVLGPQTFRVWLLLSGEHWWGVPLQREGLGVASDPGSQGRLPGDDPRGQGEKGITGRGTACAKVESHKNMVY